MHILFIILKIIGWIFLSILILMLALLLIVLCTPVRYRLWGEKTANHIDVRLKAGVWLYLVGVSAEFTDNVLKVMLKIFFYRKPLFEMSFLDKGEEDNNASDETWQSMSLEEAEDEEIVKENTNEKEAAVNTEEPVNKEKALEEKASEINSAVEAESDLEIDDASEIKIDIKTDAKEKDLFERIEEAFSKITDKVSGVFNRLQETYEKLVRKKDLVLKFLDLPSTKHVLLTFRKQTIKVLKSILPKKLEGELTLGFEDPELMGKLCMYFGILYPVLDKNFHFNPVFNENVVEGKGVLRGRIIAGAVLGRYVRFIFMRDFYRFIGNLKRLLKKLK